MPSYCCPTCEMTFRSQSQLAFHNSSKKHNAKINNEPLPEEKPKRAYNKKVKEVAKPVSDIPISSEKDKSNINKIKNLILSFD